MPQYPQWPFEGRLSKTAMAHSFSGETPQDQNKESKPLSLDSEWSGVLRAVWTVEQKAALCSSGLSGFRSMGSCHVAKASITSSRKMAWKMRQSYCGVVMMACTDRFNSVLSDTTFIKTWDGMSTAYLMATQPSSVMPAAGPSLLGKSFQ
jgi:hypothetical protein